MSVNLFANLQAGACLITSNVYQAQQFRLAYAQWKRSQDIEAWSSPRIYSWMEWLKTTGENLLWSGYSGSEGVRSLLTPLQEQIVWQEIIKDKTESPLLHIPSTAKIARNAWNTLQAWRLPNPTNELYHSHDVVAFAAWVEEYFVRCRDNAWLDHARLPDTLKRAISKGLVELPQKIILAGFIQLTPQQQELVKAVQAQGVQVSLYKSTEHRAIPQAFSYPSERDELVAVANWCRQTLESNPLDRIAVVLPKLSQRRDQLDYILRKTLFPSSFSSGVEFVNAAYQFTSGFSLKDSQIAKTAITLLELMQGILNIDQISYLLRSPYLYAGKEEHLNRVHLDRWLRKKNYLRFDLNGLIDAIASYRFAKDGRYQPSLFEVSLQTLKSTMGLSKQRFLPSEWAKHFQVYIEKFGWPGAQLSTREQHDAKNIRSALSELASLDYVLEDMDYFTALTNVKRIYRSKTFAATQIFAPIQIMDLQDVYSLNYDHIWIAGLDDKALPEPASANPMLPFSWQQQKKIINATPETRMEEAQKRLRHLATSAPNVVFSYSQDGLEELEKAPCMLRRLEYIPQESIYFEAQKHAEIEWVEENYGPEYMGSLEVTTQLFKDQMACPFKGFAEHRLFPEKLLNGEHGLNALQRGILVHQLMEYVWQQIGASDTLDVALQSNRLEMQVWKHVDHVVEQYEIQTRKKLSARLKVIEVQRLVRLTMQWLKIESSRAPFELRSSEKEEQIKIGKFTVNCRIDRLDEVKDAGFAIIDYKSGVHTPAEWFGDSIREPQMPIYALLEGKEIVAIMYANLKPKEMGFKGIAKYEELFPTIKEFDSLPPNRRYNLSWSNLRNYWRKNLEVAGQDFLKGYAVPFQKDGKECKNCDLQSLCRARALVSTGEISHQSSGDIH